MGKSAHDFLSPEEQDDIQQAIMNAECDTSGEIRVHIERECPADVMDRAAYLFRQLDMHKTQLRNGVLFYLALNNRRFAIIGDKGINQKVPENFWDDIKLKMIDHFRDGRFAEGLVYGITVAGEQLKKHFPYYKNDVNELSDDISFGS
jgi:uncharacterized membrane protein